MCAIISLMKCPACGTALVESSRCCNSCGRALDPEDFATRTISVPDDVQMTSNTSAWYFGTGVAILAAFLALAIWGSKISIGHQKLIARDW